MKQFDWVLLAIFSFFCFAMEINAQQKNFGDRLEGLVYEVEDWSEPRDAWVTDEHPSNKWCLWTKEDDIWNKRSQGKTLQSPHVVKDRSTAEEGAMPLHTKITGVPNGSYNVYCNATCRTMAFSFDAGKTWCKGTTQGEVHFGYFEIKDGTFEVWVDDRYVYPNDPGCAYYDYIRFVPTSQKPEFHDVKSFLLPNGDTQLSWISDIPMSYAYAHYGQGSQRDKEVKETTDPMRNHALILTDLPRNTDCGAELYIPINMRDGTICYKMAFRTSPPAAGKATKKTQVKLRVTEPTDTARKNWPVTSGVPFAQGILASTADVCLRDSSGKFIPVQFDVFARWPDGSVKWLLCDFNADTRKDEPVYYTLETAPGLAKNIPVVDTSFTEKAKKELEALANNLDSQLVLGNGTRLCSRMVSPQVETAGALRTTMTCEGDYVTVDGTPRFRWFCNLSRFSSGLIRVQWGLDNNIAGSIHTLIRSASVLVKNDKPVNHYQLLDGKQVTDLYVLQDLYRHATITTDQGKVNCDRFNGLVFGAKGLWFRNFDKTWPKGMKCDRKGTELFLLPELPEKEYPGATVQDLETTLIHYYWYRDGSYLFKRGMTTLNEFWLFDTEQPRKDLKSYDKWLSNPLFAVADPKYYCETGVYPPVNPARSGHFDSYENAFDVSFKRLEEYRQKRGEFGWMNFGDWYGERTWNWGNNEYDLPYACSLQFIRTGRLDYLQRACEMATHYTTIDVTRHWQDWNPRQREIVYEHCSGHVGDFLSKDDPCILADLKLHPKTEWMLSGVTDGSGGHCFQPGNFYIACLTGDKRVFQVAEEVCRHQATYYTPDFSISIERAAGWALTNAVYAYNFTGNPFYLNAAKIYYGVIDQTQNPVTGCLDLRQDQTECDCPDKKEHRGGKAFATGVLLHGLARFYEVEHDEKVKTTIVRCANWLLDYSWNEEAKGFRYKTGCPKFANKGWYAVIVAEGIAFATEITGNRRYVEFLDRTLYPQLRPVSGDSVGRSYGKDFTMTFRQTPHALYYMEKYKKK